MPTTNFKYRASELILKWLRGELAEAEEKELTLWKEESGEHQTLFEELTNEERLSENVRMMRGLKERIDSKVYAEIADAEETVSIFRQRFQKWAVAASILLAIGVSSYLLFFNKTGKQIPHYVRDDKMKDVKAPETNRAMVTLADGSKLYLDSVGNGQLAVQGNASVVKTADGKIVYRSLASLGITKEVYNTLSNPRGSKVIDMTLADGSRVWLNAGSSVTYPVAFIGNERKVSITGEAYFEVAHNPTMPFRVSKNNMEVTVLGTHFNVNAYDDESTIKVTLLEGSVKVASTASRSDVIIKPGQQAQVSSDVKVINNVSLDEVMAWKKGLFSFNRADIKTVMRQLARWYDVEVDFEGNVPPQLFGGEIQRTVTLSKVLENLEKYGVRSRIENKKIIVLP